MENELERALAESAEDHSTQAMALTAHAAHAQGWWAIAVIEEPVRRGTRQHGCALISRGGPRFLIGEEERVYAVLTWIYSCESGTVFFEAGEYDLTRAEALESFVVRGRLAQPEPAGRR